jgi:hypothetical protein
MPAHFQVERDRNLRLFSLGLLSADKAGPRSDGAGYRGAQKPAARR